MKTIKTWLAPRFPRSGVSALLGLGAVIGIGDALSYYPTSVVPSLPGPEQIRARPEEGPTGLAATLRRAYRRSVDKGWVGIPALDRRSSGEGADPAAMEPRVERTSPAATDGDRDH